MFDEIVYLHNMLTCACIPHDFRPLYGGYQVLYYNKCHQ